MGDLPSARIETLADGFDTDAKERHPTQPARWLRQVRGTWAGARNIHRREREERRVYILLPSPSKDQTMGKAAIQYITRVGFTCYVPVPLLEQSGDRARIFTRSVQINIRGKSTTNIPPLILIKSSNWLCKLVLL